MAKKEVKETKEEPPKEAPKPGKKEPPKEAKREEAKKEARPKAKKEAPKKEPKREAPKEGKEVKKEPGKEEIKHIVRIAETDLDGKKSVHYALTGIKGISRRTAGILAIKAGLDPMATTGYLKDEEIERLQHAVGNFEEVIPGWMMNRQNDLITGEDRHIIGTDVMLSVREDVNLMKKTRSYKGIRHERGLRVRGQRTRSTGRKGRTVGVTKAAAAAAAAEKKKEEAKR